MSRLSPIWTAARLNEALAKAEKSLFVGLGPDGRIETHDEVFRKSSPALERQREVIAKRRSQTSAFVELLASTREFEAALRQLPPLLAFLSIDPEPWCQTVIQLGALDSIGPFLDYASPLWEWLVRAARAGRAIILPFRVFSSTFGWQDRSFDKKQVPFPELVHGERSGAPGWLQTTLSDFELGRVEPNVKSAADATAVAAGLMEMHDLRESHELAQSIEGRGRNRAGDYWHAIHHRREPDPGNAKYWLRKVGPHPIHEALATASRSLLSAAVISNEATEMNKGIQRLTPNGAWDAFAFVDFCEQAAKDQNPEHVWAARRLQFLEMTLLLDSAYTDATS